MRLTRTAGLDAFAAVAIGAAVLAVFGNAFLNYDSFYALAWGDELAHGHAPSYELPVAPTPHPLAVLAGATASPLGDNAEFVLVAAVLLALGALCVGLFRLGQELFAWPVGALAAAIVATRVPFLDFGLRGYVDLPAVALVVWAAVLEARRPRRGAAVLALLALAGLLRPEAWLLSAAYWLWLLPAHREVRARIRFAALAATAPLLWALADLLVTGDPLWSLNGTSDLAEDLGRRTGLGAVPSVLPDRLGEILRLPELIAAVLGFAAALVWMRRRALLPTALLALNGLTFLVFAVAGLPLLGRYLFLSSAVLALFAAVAVFGWWGLDPAHRARGPWRIAGTALLAVVLAFFTVQADRLSLLRDTLDAQGRVHHDLRELADQPRARELLGRCRPAYVTTATLIPSLAYWTDSRPGQVRSARLEMPSRGGVFVAPANADAEALSRLDEREPGREVTGPPPGFRPVERNRSWVLYAGCPS